MSKKQMNKSELLSEISNLSNKDQKEIIEKYINKSKDPLGDLTNKNRMITSIVDSLTKADHKRILEKFAKTNRDKYLKSLRKDALENIVSSIESGTKSHKKSKNQSTHKVTEEKNKSTHKVINIKERQATRKPVKRQIKKMDSQENTMTAVDFGDLPDIDTFFFNGKEHADETNGNFMNEFRNIHNAEKARASIMGPSVVKMSLPNLSKLFSNSSIMMSVPAPKDMKLLSESIERELNAIKTVSGTKSGSVPAVKSHELLTRYMIQSRSDLDTWVRIIIPSTDHIKNLQEALEQAERTGMYPSNEELTERFDKLKVIFKGLDFDSIKTSVQKCKILENEIKISRASNTSYEYRTAVYVLYKLLNRTEPYVKLA